MKLKEYRELESCYECGGNLKWSDNSIDKIKNNDGVHKIDPIYHCSRCDTYYIGDADEEGMLYIKLNKWDVKRLGCDKWNFK